MLAVAYLFELFHVDVELAAEFGLGVREGRDLGAECAASGGLIFCGPALLFELGIERGDFRIFDAQDRFVVKLAKLVLFAESLDSRFDTVPVSAVLNYPVVWLTAHQVRH